MPFPPRSELPKNELERVKRVFPQDHLRLVGWRGYFGYNLPRQNCENPLIFFSSRGKRHQVKGNIGEEWNLLAGRGSVNDDDELPKVFLLLERVSCGSNECE